MWPDEMPAVWTPRAGIMVLDLPDGASGGGVLGMSDSHAVAVGYSLLSGVIPAATRWSDGAPSYLGAGLAHAAGVSGDGVVVVGHGVSFGRPQWAFRWTQEDGPANLGTLGGDLDSSASAVSRDGGAIVGWSGYGPISAERQAFRWTRAGGMQGLGFAPGGYSSVATVLDSDGSVIAGEATADPDGVGSTENGLFRWTAAGGMQYLGTLAPRPDSFDFEAFARGMSAAGDAIVGYSEDYKTGYKTALYWSAGTGVVDLDAYLTGLGLDRGPYHLLTADCISPDGRTIAGLATTNGFDAVGYVVTNIPSPGAVVLLGLGAFPLRRRRS